MDKITEKKPGRVPSAQLPSSRGQGYKADPSGDHTNSRVIGGSEVHKIGDLELAAFLAATGERLKAVRENGSGAEFYFSESPKLQHTIVEFAAGAAAPPKALFTSLKLMTSLAKIAVMRSETNPKTNNPRRVK